MRRLPGLSEFSYADVENYSVGAAELSETVEHIEIHWLVGNVTGHAPQVAYRFLFGGKPRGLDQ